jgi:hypothetical protein
MPKTGAGMQLVIDDLSVLVSKKKVSPTLILPKIVPVVQKDGKLVEISKTRLYLNKTNGEPITDGVTYRDTYMDNGVEIPEPLYAVQKPDGTLQRCSLYQRTTAMMPDAKSPFISLSELQNFVFDGGVYEVYISASKYNKNELSRMLSKAYDKAEQLVQSKKAMRFKFVHRDNSMRMYIAHLWPIIQRKEDGSLKFVFLMGLSTTALHFDNMMDVPNTATVAAEDIVEEPEVAIDAISGIKASTGRVQSMVQTL